MLRFVGWVLMIGALLASVGEIFGLDFPTVGSGFDTTREFSFLTIGTGTSAIPWLAWLITIASFFLGGYFVFALSKRFKMTPITERRIERFRSIRRGYISMWILIVMVILGACDHLLVGNKAIYVRYDDKSYFPALVKKSYKAADFGVSGDTSQAPPSYRDLRRQFKAEGKGNRVIMPLIPFAPTGDTIPALSEAMEERDGLLYRKGEVQPYSGLASTLYSVDDPERAHVRYRFRKGLRDGAADGWDRNANPVYTGEYKEGELVRDQFTGEGYKESFLNDAGSALRIVHYNPAPPVFGQGHLLGTTPQGYDLLAYLFGGLQVNIQAALFYIPCVYFIGISVGLLMGFFGGTFDIVVQRIIEILSNIPFLFVIIIISSSVPEQFKGLGIILIILILFGWMGMTYVMRAAALKEKSRDYVKSARVIGSGTPRILFKHILPNSLAIVVTLIPFSISSVILSITSLDYLGFGLPPKYATWGRLLSDGLANLSSPWLVTSAFIALVAMLVLVTFVGEAVREAFDPKKYTTYR